MRTSGVLMHISSLPGPGGCGNLGREARAFVDFLAEAGQGLWQVLPLTPPARGNSPYSSHSVFAGNPFFIDLEELAGLGLLSPTTLADFPQGEGKADFAWCEQVQIPLLRESYSRLPLKWKAGMARFREEQSFWLEDYALFMALKKRFQGAEYGDWPAPLRMREQPALDQARRTLRREMDFWVYTQFLFYRQWRALKTYANSQGVKLMGDMPIYADRDSADVWANPHVFQLDRERRPKLVAGVPPDAFSDDGQLWGNPLYNWTFLKSTQYRWWTERMRSAAALFDHVRLDHFRALADYWAVPAGAATAKGGKWLPGPGMNFLRELRQAVPHLRIVAEDLGLLDNRVRRLLRHSRFPGMKVLQFAFDPDGDSDYLPHNFISRCVGYTGTHDNNTIRGWLEEAGPNEAAFAKKYMGIQSMEDAHWDVIRTLYATPAETVIVPMQDYLGLGAESRMNVPGVAEGNWTWRMEGSAVPEGLALNMRALAATYRRLPKQPVEG